MDRPQRIRIVMVATVGLITLVAGLFSAPLVAVLTAPSSAAELEQSMPQFIHAIQLANQVGLVCLAISGCCLLYLLIAFAVWFIGPKDKG
jgi:hypothetical protein